MTKEKTVNYPPETTAKMVEMYQAAADSDEARKAAMLEIQAFTGKSIPSIRAKLGSEGVYIALAKVEAKGKTSLSKAELVAQIQDNEPEKPSGFFDSLEAANKTVLKYVVELQQAPVVDATENEAN